MVSHHIYLLLWVVVLVGCNRKLPQPNDLIGRYKAKDRPEIIQLNSNGIYYIFNSESENTPRITNEFDIDLSDRSQPCITFSKLKINKNDKNEIIILPGTAFVPFYISSESQRWVLTVFDSEIDKLSFVEQKD